MYSRILLPTDGSETAQAAVDHALSLAERYDADIHVVHVIDTHRYDTSIDSLVAPLRRAGEQYVERATAATAGEGVDVTTAIEMGRPGRALLEYIDERDVDLVVMGTSGRGGLARRLLGSVTNYLVTHAAVPVHVTPPVDGTPTEETD
jgi:nucleotide-binding universal stress UspA family protein